MIESFYKAMNALSESLPWIIMGAVVGATMNAQVTNSPSLWATVRGYIASLICGIGVGTVAVLMAKSSGVTNADAIAYIGMGMAMFGKDAYPVIRERILRALPRRQSNGSND